MEYVTTGGFLIVEWFRTFIIFLLMDRIIGKKQFKEGIKNHDNYLLSLFVGAFILVARARELSFTSFILWSFIVILSYIPVKFAFRKILKRN